MAVEPAFTAARNQAERLCGTHCAGQLSFITWLVIIIMRNASTFTAYIL